MTTSTPQPPVVIDPRQIWSAFQQVERRRVWNKRDTEAIRRIKQSLAQA